MKANRLTIGLIPLLMVGLAACEGGAEESPDAVLTDTITQPGTATVQVPVTDTAIVQQEITIDTMVDTDTIVREGEATTTEPPR